MQRDDMLMSIRSALQRTAGQKPGVVPAVHSEVAVVDQEERIRNAEIQRIMLTRGWD